LNYHYLPIYILTAALGTSYYQGFIPPAILIIFSIISLLTYLIYAKDKRAARHNEWRTSESTLHLYSLLCGWPGAIVAQQRLRHKSKKTSFRAVFILTVIINASLISWLHTYEGAQILRSYSGKVNHLIALNISNQHIKGTISSLFKFRKEQYAGLENGTFYIRKSKEQ
jgi:uncharacterized membrane protein YsdA (DUF1294 family)